MRLLLALILFAFSSLPVSAQGGETRQYFGDWLAACGADGYCSAVAYMNPNPGEGRVADAWLRIGRHAEETYWEVSFTPIKVMADPDLPFTVLVDGTGETFTGADEIAPYGAVNDYFLLGPKAQSVMDQLMPGAAVDITFTDETGATAGASFSLNGLTAALIWIDETQGRLGSERVAEAPPVGIDPALAAPRQPEVGAGEVTMADIPPDLIAQDAARPDACDGFDIVGELPFYVYPVASEKVLYFLPCTAGAYNRFYSVYVGMGAWYDLQLFATPSYRAGWQAEQGVWLGGFDPETGQLSSYNLGRSTGDCGLRGLWQWTGSTFVMLEYRMKPDCDAAGEPGDFPLVYRNETPPEDLLR